jgi:hypothetical protein
MSKHQKRLKRIQEALAPEPLLAVATLGPEETELDAIIRWLSEHPGEREPTQWIFVRLFGRLEGRKNHWTRSY